jgi:DNA-binding transcriptional MocR family regulator
MSIGSKRRARRTSGPPFVRLFRFIKRSQAWHDLSLPARCALIELIDRYNGINNGMIGLGVRTLADELKCSQATATRALRELDDSGLAAATTVGFWRGKRATEWRLTFHRCDKTGDLPNKNWPAREVHQGSAKGSLEKRNEALRFTSKAQTPKNPINVNALRFTREAHIDIYHRDTDLSTRSSLPESERIAEPYPELPEFLKRRNVQ